jgi:GT2 family glycosyltransferase
MKQSLENKFCILIPTINRADLLNEALIIYAKSYPNTCIYVLDNGNQEITIKNPNVILYKMDRLGVAESWNFLIRKAVYHFDYFLILNDDIVLENAEENINKIIYFDDRRTFYVCQPQNNWSSFLLSISVYLENGKFDEGFVRCYYEDNDYAYRFKLNDIKVSFEPKLNPTIYRNSQTILKEPTLSNSQNNRLYYIKKWGGEPNQEIYKTPFDFGNSQ